MTRGKRKSPIHHKVRNHNRKNTHVNKYDRGHGEKKTTKKRIKKPNPYVTKRKITKTELRSLSLWPQDYKEGEPLQMFGKKFKEGDPMDLWGKEAKIKPKPKGKPLDYWGEPLDKRPFDPYGPKEAPKPLTKVKVPKEPTRKEVKGKPFDYWTQKEDKKDSFDPYEPKESPKLPAKEEKPEKEEPKKEEPKVEEPKKEPKEEVKPWDMYEKPIPPTTKKEIPMYSRMDLEKVFLGADEAESRNRAETLGLTFEEERLEPQTGEKVLEYRFPLESDLGEDATTRPMAYEEVDLTIDLRTGAVTDVWTQKIMSPEETGLIPKGTM